MLKSGGSRIYRPQLGEERGTPLVAEFVCCFHVETADPIACKLWRQAIPEQYQSLALPSLVQAEKAAMERRFLVKASANVQAPEQQFNVIHAVMKSKP